MFEIIRFSSPLLDEEENVLFNSFWSRTVCGSNPQMDPVGEYTTHTFIFNEMLRSRLHRSVLVAYYWSVSVWGVLPQTVRDAAPSCLCFCLLSPLVCLTLFSSLCCPLSPSLLDFSPCVLMSMNLLRLLEPVLRSHPFCKKTSDFKRQVLKGTFDEEKVVVNLSLTP